MRHRSNRKYRQVGAASALLLVAVAFGLVACKKSQPADNAKRYHLTGKVVSIDTDRNSITVDMHAIPGYMDAMAMPFTVLDAHNLASVHTGDEIAADLVVKDDSTYVDNIIVTKKGSSTNAPPPGAEHVPQRGERVPDFAMVNQDGKRIHLGSYRGNVLLVTFIYTRCPFPDYCPLVSRNFAKIYAATRKDGALHGRIRLLSVSFDPKHDTPAVLKHYGGTFRQTTGDDPFDRWEFAVVSAKDLPKIADFFGFFTNPSGGQIVHSMSTTVISPEGAVYKWYEDNAWAPEDLLADATAALQQNETGATTTAQARAETPKGSLSVRTN